MGKQMLGRLTSLVLGMILGIAATLWVMPIHLDGEWMLVDRIGYSGKRKPAPGDRIIIESAVFTEYGDGGRLARRVAGVEGEQIRIENGRLCVDGEDAMDLWPGLEEFPEDMTTVVVEEDHVFVLGDDVLHGLDSRSEAVGQVPEAEIWGRVIYTRKEN